MPHSDYIKCSLDYSVEEGLLVRIPIIVKVLEQVTAQNKWDYSYAEGKWTVKQVVQHLIDCEKIFSYRALHIARQDTSELFGFEEDAYAITSMQEEKNGEDMIHEYTALLLCIYYQFKGYTKDILQRESKVANYEISIENIGRVMYGHSLHHLDVLLERYLD
ncbi:MAG: DinB family protein [Flavobacteriaceae bacterium]|jgi:hypothetical protein|nr:DinB family protein [Flavobacteriaceae bacterium]